MKYGKELAVLMFSFCLATGAFPQWNLSVIDGWANASGCDVAFDVVSKPIIVYTRTTLVYIGGSQYTASLLSYLAKWNGASWTLSTLPAITEQSYNNFPIIVNPPKVFATSDTGIFVVRGCQLIGTPVRSTKIYVEGVGDLATFPWYRSDCCIDPASTRSNYILYFLYRDGSHLYYRQYPTDSPVMVDEFATPGKIVRDANGNLHIVYHKDTGGGFLKYGLYDGTWHTWPIEPLINSNSYSLVLDDNGVPILYAQTGSSPNYAVSQIIIDN